MSSGIEKRDFNGEIECTLYRLMTSLLILILKNECWALSTLRYSCNLDLR